jgi:hypothetical protein
MIGFILYIVAYILLLPMTIINFFVVFDKGYFKSTALSIDIFANREFRASWNKFLRKSNGYSFGKLNETISRVLGKNQRDGTLTKTGIILCWILDKIDKDHCKKSINDNI